MIECQDVSLAASLGLESVLAITQDFLSFQMVNSLGENGVFKRILATQ